MKPESHLAIFNKLEFLPALKAFFNELKVPINYVADESIASKEILKDTYKSDDRKDNPFQLMEDVYFLGMVDDAAFEGNNSLQLNQIKSDYDGILIFGVTLKARPNNLLPTRSQLAEISRAFNREFYYTPVVVVFKYGTCLAFANTERLPYKQEWREGEKAGKVTLLRDINIAKPHSGHERILVELKIPTTGKNKVDSFAKLYTYWQQVFSVSVLNKKFYQELSTWYFWATKHVTFPGAPTLAEAHLKNTKLEDLLQEHRATNVIRMLTRLLFVWFIKEKKLVPEELFDLETLQKDILKKIAPYHENGIFKEANKESVYYKAILQNLFFASLNCPIEGDSLDKRTRGFRGDGYGTHRGIDYLMRYKQYFKDPDRFLEMINKTVPFLNGGLFECLDDKFKNIYIDGFSDQMTKGEQLIVPDYLFFGIEEEADISDVVGITDKKYKNAAVKGLINILKSYKFTINENTPIEEDVALDPELLGKVFENLLASYNPETKTTARKQTGSFYTPREIVNYMVDESLISYLKNRILSEKQVFIDMGKKQTYLFGNHGVVGQQSFQVDVTGSKLKEDEKKLDALLHELVSFNPGNPFQQYPITANIIVKYLNECTILDPACGSGAFPMGVLQKMVHILQKLDPNNQIWKQVQETKARKEADEAFSIEDKNAREERLLEINEAFDQSTNDPDYARKLFLIENCIYGVDIQPIATQISKLRFFISLVVEQKVNSTKDNFGIRPLPNLETKFVAANTLIDIDKPSAQLSLYDTKEVKTLEIELKKVRHKLFSAKSKDTKLKYRQRDEELRTAIATELEKSGWKSDTAQKLADWDPYDQNKSSPFFDSEWMFDIKDGFDIVIGNPPYGFHQIHSQELKKYFKRKFKSASSSFENYFLFYEKSLTLLKSNGSHSFIVPVTWLTIPSAYALRKFILSNFFIDHISWLNNIVFNNAQVNTLVSLIRKCTPGNVTISKFNKSKDLNNPSNTLKIQQKKFIEEDYYMSIFEDNVDTMILKTISQASSSLVKYFNPCSGYNPYEVGKGVAPGGGPHTKQTIEEKPYHSDIRIDNNWKPEIVGRELSRYFTRFSGKRWVKYGKWLSAPRDQNNFIGKRILVQEVVGGSEKRIVAAYYDKELYHSRDVLPIKMQANSPHPFILLTILNSSLIRWYHHKRSPKAKKGLFPKVLVSDLKTFPIVIPDEEVQQLLILIVDMIIHIKAQEIENKYFFKFDEMIDSIVFNLYFADHMKDRNIEVLEFVRKDVEEVIKGRGFETLKEIEKADIIEQLHERWTHPDSEVRNRIKLFVVRSPEILKPILESQ